MSEHMQRAIAALEAISADWADYEVIDGDVIEVLPYWSPECVDPDGRPIGTARVHVAQWKRIVEALEGADFTAAPVDNLHIGRLLAIVGGRLHEGAPVRFRYCGGEG